LPAGQDLFVKDPEPLAAGVDPIPARVRLSFKEDPFGFGFAFEPLSGAPRRDSFPVGHPVPVHLVAAFELVHDLRDRASVLRRVAFTDLIQVLG